MWNFSKLNLQHGASQNLLVIANLLIVKPLWEYECMISASNLLSDIPNKFGPPVFEIASQLGLLAHCGHRG
jgi:hypothetical protein